VSRARRGVRVAAGLAAVCGLVVLAVWMVERGQTTTLADRLVVGANAIASATYPRAAHVANPQHGTFGAALTPLLPKMRKVHDEVAAEKAWEQCRAAAPIADLSETCRSLVANGRDTAREVLAATHTDAAGMPDGLRALDAHGAADGSWAAIMMAVKIASLDAKQQVQAGNPSGAIDTCLDALAFARDIGIGSPVVGRMFGTAATNTAFSACAGASMPRTPRTSGERSTESQRSGRRRLHSRPRCAPRP
jgi:hypothetical protein